ncbi:MAG: HPr kinase/phosphorylase [Desulfomonilaceae bacterium]
MKTTGVLVMVHGVGVLIRGPSGAGKSLAALNLMRRGHSLIADDLVEVTSGPGGEPIGRSVEEEVRIEVRGLGVFAARTLFLQAVVPSSRIDFVVDLDTYDHLRDAGRIVPETGTVRLCEHDLMTVRVPLPTRVDPALLIELLAWRFKQSGTV